MDLLLKSGLKKGITLHRNVYEHRRCSRVTWPKTYCLYSDKDCTIFRKWKQKCYHQIIFSSFACSRLITTCNYGKRPDILPSHTATFGSNSVLCRFGRFIRNQHVNSLKAYVFTQNASTAGTLMQNYGFQKRHNLFVRHDTPVSVNKSQRYVC
jgi:hypothetical protein